MLTHPLGHFPIMDEIWSMLERRSGDWVQRSKNMSCATSVARCSLRQLVGRTLRDVRRKLVGWELARTLSVDCELWAWRVFSWSEQVLLHKECSH